MAREELIHHIKYNLEIGKEVTLTDDDCKEIIKALSTEPCEDAISRKDTCTAIIKRLGIKDETFLLEAERAIYQQILAMPPVQPIRPKGEWIGEKEYPICPKCNCNVIGKYISCSEYAEMYEPMNFCPNCGADMKGDKK